MNAAINELVKSIVKKDSLSECSVSELQRLTTQYPYFAPLQFLLAQKLKEENSPLYQKQSQKAILYFHDHLWFDYLSGSNSDAAIITSSKEEIISPEHFVPATTILTEEKVGGPVKQEEAINDVYREPIPEPAEIIIEEEKITALAEQEETISNVYTEPSQEHGEIPVAEEEKTTTPVEQEETITNSYTESTSLPVQENIIVTEEKRIDPVVSEQVNPPQEQLTETIQEEKEQLPKFPAFKIEPLNATAAKLAFEPYHTVDYFASQGIRFKEEEKPKSRLDQQLKSFTEWLKAMKRLPDAETATTPAAPEDKIVTKMAEHSIVDREVVTEAMADVWEQQGNHQKAIETYHKLSLLNPSKSAYFAGKIEHLKHL